MKMNLAFAALILLQLFVVWYVFRQPLHVQTVEYTPCTGEGCDGTEIHNYSIYFFRD